MKWVLIVLFLLPLVVAQDGNVVEETPAEKIQAVSVLAEGCDWYITEEATEKLCGKRYHAFCASDYLLEAECSYDDYIKSCQPELCLFDQLRAKDDKINELNITIIDLNAMTLPALARTVKGFEGQLKENNLVAQQPWAFLSTLGWVALICLLLIFKVLPWWNERQAKRFAGIVVDSKLHNPIVRKAAQLKKEVEVAKKSWQREGETNAARDT